MARVSRKIPPRPLDELTTLLLMTSSEVSRLSLLTNWSVVTFTNWCRYFTQLLLLPIEFLHLLKALTLLFHLQVLEESLRLTIDYLSNEEKVVVANSKVHIVEAKSSRLRKDLIEVMDQVTKAMEKVKELKDALKVEKKLVIQKDKEVQAALLKTDKEHEKVITKFLESDRFSNLQFV